MSIRQVASQAELANRAQLKWVWLAAVLTILPHFTYQYAWVCITAFVILSFRGYSLWSGQSLAVLKWLNVPLAFGLAVAVYFQFDRRFFGIVPGIAYLTIMLALKLQEGAQARDIRIALFLMFFLQLGLFFNVQDAFSAVAAIISAWVATTALVSGYDPESGFRGQLKSSGLMLIQALPFMVVFFLVFPRISAPLWGQNNIERQGKTGLSDTMKPGDVNRLSLSDEIAFRVEFQEVPSLAMRYWRGPVLENFDGQTWSMALGRLTEAPFFEPSGRGFAYSMTLEAHNRPWLLGMDFSVGKAQGEFRYNGTFAVLSNTLVTERRRFSMEAYPETLVGLNEQESVLQRNRFLPRQSNPRTQAFVKDLIPPETPPELILSKVINHFIESKYTYTLEPPPVGPQAVDDFLFETRQGFCEYFAAAFVVMMRSAGVPARVVTGYLGGELNPMDGTLVIRQADAHAWAEVWLAGKGWTRVDPTVLSVPGRLDLGMARSQNNLDALPMLMRPEFDWLRQAKYRWEAVANAWNQWVLGYNQEKQREFFQKMGIKNPDWKTLITLFFSIGFLLALGLIIWAYRYHSRQDALDRVWMRFCQRMGKAGVIRQPWEGPFAYGERLAVFNPSQAKAVREIVAMYAQLRYQRSAWQNDLPILKARIGAFRLA